MDYEFHVRRLALADLDDAAEWYRQRDQALPTRFLSEVDRVFLRLRASPKQFPLVEGGVRRALLPKFPYSVYFELAGPRVTVLAVVHVSRHHRSWTRGEGGEKR